MKTLLLDEKWTFRRGYLDSISMAQSDPGTEVDLPHDGTISLDTDAKAPGGGDLAFYPGTLSSYTKNVFFPKEWEEECVGLQFDGVMMNASLDLNGCRVALWHNGYMPFYADLTPYITFGGENRITINVNTATGSNSRWYTGSGLYRSVKLVHGPKVRIPVDGIFVYTKEVSEGLAYLEALIDAENAFSVSHMAETELILENEKTGDECL